MRTLSATLLAAQKSQSRIPYLRVRVLDRITGARRLLWTRLYTGAEEDSFHGATMPADGSLVRTRIDSAAQTLYRQRVESPGPGSDFSRWTSAASGTVKPVAICSRGAEVDIFYFLFQAPTTWRVMQLTSNDYGATWGAAVEIDTTPSANIYGASATAKSNGDIGLFWIDQATVYRKRRTGGSWEARAAWDKTTGNLSGIAAHHEGDWDLIVTGLDSDSNFKLSSLIYGDGGDVTAGTWSDLEEIASAPSDGAISYKAPFLDRLHVYRSSFVEKFTGDEAYARPFHSHLVIDTSYLSSLWREPVPFNLEAEHGLSLAHHGDYTFMECPFGVWRAYAPDLGTETADYIDVSDDILALKEEADPGKGKLTVELRNDDGRYASPGEGDLALLNLGSQVEVSPGYRVSGAAPQCSQGPAYWIDGWEHTSQGGKAAFIIHAEGGFELVERWRARHQFRWNKDPANPDKSVRDILEFLLSRAGIRLEVVSSSTVLTGYYPDFTIHPNQGGIDILRKLLSIVPGALFFEGPVAIIRNPQAGDASEYSYGTDHAILQGKYRLSAYELNRVQVFGRNAALDEIMADSFAWDEISLVYDRFRQLQDINLDTVARLTERGEAYLRGEAIEAVGGAIEVPANCGQQLYDVIDITDERAGLTSEKRRVLSLMLVFDTKKGSYSHRLALGGV